MKPPPFLLPTLIAVTLTLLLTTPRTSAQVNVTTWQANLQHTGNNASETILTPGNISSPGNFGLLFSQTLDGQTYGQPLLVSNVTINNTAHNVVYVATQHGSLYAFDADNNTAANASPLWQVSLLPTGTVPVPQTVVGSSDIPLELAVTTTPVIDPASRTIYLVSKVQQTSNTTYHQFLYALDLATGAKKFNSPVEITASFPGTDGGNHAITIPFDPLREHLRCAMALYNGIIYLAYASHSDTNPYHGEVLGYDATTLQLTKQFITSPNGGSPEGGIWQSGASPAVDSAGNMFLAVGNGAWDQKNSANGTNWGESFLKLPTTGTFNVSYSNPLNWFTPNNWATLNNGDLDLGSGGLTLLPDQSGPHPHIMVGGGKGAVLYVVDRDNLGGLNTPDAAIQEIPEIGGDWFFSTPAYFNGCLYYSCSGGPLEQRAVAYNPTDGTYVSTAPITSADTFNNKGYGCFISSQGTANGIVWILTGSGVRAYNAANVSGNPIYSANATIPGNPSIGCQNTKFSLPIVANGKLYYTAYSNTNVGHLFVYGLLPTAVGTPAAPGDATAVTNTSSSITVSWTTHSTNESDFEVRRSTSPTSGFARVGSVGAGVTSYRDLTLKPSTAYYYQVLAHNANGYSNASNVASATTFPSYYEPGLVAYWPLDESAASTVADVTGHSHSAPINGEATLVPDLINNGINFHGTGEATSNVAVPDAADLRFTATQSFTLSAWVNPAALRATEETVLSKSRDTGNYYGLWISANTSGSPSKWIVRGPGADITGPAVTAGAWTHVAIVQDGPAHTRTLYVNGTAAATGAAQPADGTGALWFAQQNVTNADKTTNRESFPGDLDEIRLYSRALAAAEITNLMGPPVLEAHSNQTAASGTFGVPVWPCAAKKIEGRKGSTPGLYHLVLNFSAPVSNVTATLRTSSGNPPVGNAGTVSYDTTGKLATLDLTGVGNAQNLALHLSGLTPGNGTADIPFNVLWGDVNSDNVVNNLDLSLVQAYATPATNAATAPYDLNNSGGVDASDSALVNTAMGTSLGAQIETDLAVFQPATALSTNGNNTAALAFDQNLSTRWESAQKIDPQYLYVDLGSVCQLHTILLYWENAGGKDYTLDVSNNAADWTPMATVTGNTVTAQYLTYPNLNATGRYVRMNGTARTTGTGTNGYGYSLYDFQVLGLSGTSSISAPTINSAATATATTNNAFSYQIAATNSPTGYNATGLPSTLTVNPTTGLISGTPTQTGTINATLTATNATGTGTAPLTITVQTPFAGWQTLNFTSAELAKPAVSGPTATPANDGITNLLKYALNLPPKVNGVAALPQPTTTTTGGHKYLTLTYTKVLAATDLAYTVEVSADMQTWNSGAAYTTTVSTTTNSDNKTQTVAIRDLTATDSGARRFIRLKVAIP